VKQDEEQNFHLVAESPINNELPWLLSGVEIPADQKVDASKPNVYFGVYALRNWITVELTHPSGFKFGKVERWWPIFDCDIPKQLQAAIDSFDSERYFEIWFRGVPSENGRYGRANLCNREVRVSEVSKIREGKIPPDERHGFAHP
jgi:hypothetical protein